ncbi:MAG: hypothetical protein R3D85_03845 [Paracoccaceae bacterium]
MIAHIRHADRARPDRQNLGVGQVDAEAEDDILSRHDIVADGAVDGTGSMGVVIEDGDESHLGVGVDLRLQRRP